MASSSINADDIFGGGSQPSASPKSSITADDIFSSSAMPTHSRQSDQRYVEPSSNFNFTRSLEDSFLTDPQTRLRVAAKRMFPNEPDAVDKYHFGFEGDRVIFMKPDKDGNRHYQYATSRASDFLGGLVGNVPEMVMGGVASLNPTAPVASGAVGVAGARGLKKVAANLIYDEPQTAKGNAVDMGVNAGAELVTGGLVKGGLTIANRGKRISVEPADLARANAQRAAIQQSTGVDADLALTSGDPGLLQIRNWLAQQPNATARDIQAADRAAVELFDKAANDVLDKIASNGPRDVLGQRGTNAAKDAIDAAIAARDQAVRPLYDKARGVRLAPDVVTDLSADPLVSRAAKRVASDPVFQRKLAGIPQDSVGYWQQVKRNLDQGYEKAAASGNKTAAAEYRDAAAQVNAKLSAASPEYAAANKAFADQTKTIVEPLQNSVVGVLAKIKDPKAATAAAKIFKDQNLTAADIYNARQVISKQDPEAWNGLVRQFVANEINAAKKVTQAGGERNVAGKLFQRIWGDPESRARMNAALGKDASDALRGLMETAEAIARAPVSGSNTQPNQAIARVFEGQSGNWARALLNPKETLSNAAKERTKDAMAAKVWAALSDPAKVKQLKVALTIPDTTKRAAYISSVLAAETGMAAVSAGTSLER